MTGRPRAVPKTGTSLVVWSSRYNFVFCFLNYTPLRDCSHLRPDTSTTCGGIGGAASLRRGPESRSPTSRARSGMEEEKLSTPLKTVGVLPATSWTRRLFHVAKFMNEHFQWLLTVSKVIWSQQCPMLTWRNPWGTIGGSYNPASGCYTHLRAHETGRNVVCRLLLEKKKVYTLNATTTCLMLYIWSA